MRMMTASRISGVAYGLHGQPQWRRKTITVGLSVGRARLGCTGAGEPTCGTGATSLAGGVLKDSHS